MLSKKKNKPGKGKMCMRVRARVHLTAESTVTVRARWVFASHLRGLGLLLMRAQPLLTWELPDGSVLPLGPGWSSYILRPALLFPVPCPVHSQQPRGWQC
jgi:hypothetical protein